MQVGLFIPCFIDQFYPNVGLATVRVLEHFGIDVHYPRAQTCCGQPLVNTGCVEEAKPLAERFLEIFASYEYVVAPSGSCVSMVRNHYDAYFENDSQFDQLKNKTFELCEFLVDVVKAEPIAGSFPHVVGMHQSCHGLRELRLASSSEVVASEFSKTRRLLENLEGIRFSQLERPDECCGFGGTFAVSEEAVSCAMGKDRIQDHQQAGTEVLTAADMSCLMHLSGLIDRNQQPIRVMHVAEIMAECLEGVAT